MQNDKLAGDATVTSDTTPKTTAVPTDHSGAPRSAGQSGCAERAGPNLALTLGGLGLIGLADCGAIAVRRNRA
ncbi:hypothetical protein [Rhodococcus sp. ARC_M6]|uniref:hypothetical protein n=1 Tax=Rhodococcus sp. ARC_M6 TaxID=2928852 RepID=UPI001FB30B29|nr:hypothetical protein [Rhodococcus sp. ARC_M6]MCJ0906823.1 hypothetical protein [Rhodococcus sp. ARC_M6]